LPAPAAHAERSGGGKQLTLGNLGGLGGGLDERAGLGSAGQLLSQQRSRLLNPRWAAAALARWRFGGSPLALRANLSRCCASLAA
jgi:hypothetical protein